RQNLNADGRQLMPVQAVCDLTGDFGAGVAAGEVPGSRFNGVRQRPRQAAERDDRAIVEGFPEVSQVGPGVARAGRRAADCDLSAAAQIVDEDRTRLLPRALLQLEAQAGQLMVEDLTRVGRSA